MILKTTRQRQLVLAALALLAAALTLLVLWRAGMTHATLARAGAVLSGAPRRATELRVWDWWSPSGNEEYGAYFEDLERTFEAQNPDVDLVLQFVPFGNYVQKLATAMVGPQPPDVFQSSVYWAEGFYHRGMLRPLNDLLAQDRGLPPAERITEEAFLPSAWRHNQSADGVVFGIPQIIDANCLLWNLDILQELAATDAEIRALFVTQADGSVDLERIRFDAVQDWEHFRRLMHKLTTYAPDGSVERAGFVIQAHGGGGGMFEPWLAANGGRFQDAAGRRALFASPNGVQTLQYLCDLYWQDRVCPAFRRQLAETELFEEHKIACMLAGTWSGKDIRRDTQGWQHLGMTAFPPGPMGRGYATVTWGNVLAIATPCRNLDAAWRYIHFVCGLEGNLLRSRHLGYNGPRLDFYETEQWRRAMAERPYLANVKQICLVGEKLRHTEIIASDHQANPIFETVLLNYPAIAAGNGPYPSIASALETAAANVQRVYDRYNRQAEAWLAQRAAEPPPAAQ